MSRQNQDKTLPSILIGRGYIDFASAETETATNRYGTVILCSKQQRSTSSTPIYIRSSSYVQRSLIVESDIMKSLCGKIGSLYMLCTPESANYYIRNAYEPDDAATKKRYLSPNGIFFIERQGFWLTEGIAVGVCPPVEDAIQPFNGDGKKGSASIAGCASAKITFGKKWMPGVDHADFSLEVDLWFEYDISYLPISQFPDKCYPMQRHITDILHGSERFPFPDGIDNIISEYVLPIAGVHYLTTDKVNGMNGSWKPKMFSEANLRDYCYTGSFQDIESVAILPDSSNPNHTWTFYIRSYNEDGYIIYGPTCPSGRWYGCFEKSTIQMIKDDKDVTIPWNKNMLFHKIFPLVSSFNEKNGRMTTSELVPGTKITVTMEVDGNTRKIECILKEVYGSLLQLEYENRTVWVNDHDKHYTIRLANREILDLQKATIDVDVFDKFILRTITFLDENDINALELVSIGFRRWITDNSFTPELAEKSKMLYSANDSKGEQFLFSSSVSDYKQCGYRCISYFHEFRSDLLKNITVSRFIRQFPRIGISVADIFEPYKQPTDKSTKQIVRQFKTIITSEHLKDISYDKNSPSIINTADYDVVDTGIMTIAHNCFSLTGKLTVLPKISSSLPPPLVKPLLSMIRPSNAKKRKESSSSSTATFKKPSVHPAFKRQKKNTDIVRSFIDVEADFPDLEKAIQASLMETKSDSQHNTSGRKCFCAACQNMSSSSSSSSSTSSRR